MAYQHYTSCESASSHSSMNQYLKMFIYGGPFGVLAVAASFATGHPLCGIIGVELMAMISILAYCDWWLNHRLVCLPSPSADDHSAVGMVVSTEPPSKKSFPDSLDTDFSVNLLFPPNPPGVDYDTAKQTSPFGDLIKEQPAITNAGLPYKLDELPKDPATGVESASLHVEFEGGGPYDLMQATIVAIGLSGMALLACLADTLIGTALGIILAILAFLAALIGLAVGLNDQGTPSDVGLPTVHTNDTDGRGADVLGVAGRWVYDAGHNNQKLGWNELHPCKRAERLGGWKGDWGAVDVGGTPTPVDRLIVDWGAAVGETADPHTVEGQKRPQHGWKIHPDVDGCEPGDDKPEPGS